MDNFETSKGLTTVIIGMIVATWGWLYSHISSAKAHGNGTSKVTQDVCDARFESQLWELRSVSDDIKWIKDRLG